MSLPKRIRQAQVQADQARLQLAKNPSDTAARAALVEWFETRGAHAWANQLLDNGHIDADAGIAAARSRWQADDSSAAAEDFDALLRANNSGLPSAYLQACRDAAARGE
jgi:hypothetical protein